MVRSGSNHKTIIFIGLMLGMLVAAVSQARVSSSKPSEQVKLENPVGPSGWGEIPSA